MNRVITSVTHKAIYKGSIAPCATFVGAHLVGSSCKPLTMISTSRLYFQVVALSGRQSLEKQLENERLEPKNNRILKGPGW